MTTQLVKSLYHVLDNPKFNKDCLSAGQIKSKDWLVQKVEEHCPDHESNDQDSLVSTLNRIDSQLDQLRHFINHDSENIDNK